ncbi:hypothetical protein [Aliivibrio fischeri]|uniref:Outer membrane protein beta-barrel domain-containing protein n=1 Tax=Aliivibrio fischeri SR5 TaxID=1088719 RepID=A0AAV3EPY8_ALIFS|nr:hypothetical protein [Aliivibrio fischeri]EHN68856.1 hypothetical protein VFSR5_A0153 [Aliivibrio fischeri SR5]
MKKHALLLALFSGVCFAKPQVYFGADALSNSSAYSLQSGFYFPVNQELDFGYELDFTQWNQDVHSFGINIKPAFRKQQFYLAPIVGMHYFNRDIDYSYSLGAEVGYDFERVTIRAGYKDVDEEFYDNDAFYVGVAVRFD